MTVSRASQVDATTTPYYHVMSRCVRRAFLCGVDRYSGRDYGHRKQWLVARLRTLGSVFTGYAQTSTANTEASVRSRATSHCLRGPESRPE